ncbi:hypothetical protein [Tolypothrix sp. VBCCA 56010]
MGHGEWGMGNGGEIFLLSLPFAFSLYPFPFPNARCPLPIAHCPMPHAH